jgi:peptidylprolyl isomerase
MTQAKNGDTVKIHYTGKLSDGAVFDTSNNKDPLQFTVGKGQVIEGFDEAVTGMVVGETKTAEIPCEKGYGPRNDNMIIVVDKKQVPPDLKPEVGQRLEVGSASGELLAVTVIEVDEENITLDANPPLAGEDLTFDLELLEIA